MIYAVKSHIFYLLQQTLIHTWLQFKQIIKNVIKLAALTIVLATRQIKFTVMHNM